MRRFAPNEEAVQPLRISRRSASSSVLSQVAPVSSSSLFHGRIALRKRGSASAEAARIA